MPFIFLLAGAFFVLPIIGGDACLSVENVGYQVLNAQGDQFCTDNIPDATGTLTNCLIQLNTSETDFNFTLNILGLYSGVLGGCGSVDPFNSLYTNAIDLTHTYIPTKVDDEVKDFNNNAPSGVVIKQPILDIFHTLGVGVGNSSALFVSDLQSQIGCNNLHTVYADAKNAFCCDVMTSIYWMISSWYLIGWTYLFCGCGAALLGRKRFPFELWGDAIQADRQRLAEERGSQGEVGIVAIQHEFEENPHDDFHEAPAKKSVDAIELDVLKSDMKSSESLQSPSMLQDGETPGAFATTDGTGGEHDPEKDAWKVN